MPEKTITVTLTWHELDGLLATQCPVDHRADGYITGSLKLRDARAALSEPSDIGGGGSGDDDPVRILRCPVCRRLTVDRPRVVRACECFMDWHESARWEPLATFNGAAAKAVWTLFQVHQIATDEECQGEKLAAGAVSVEDAIDTEITQALTALALNQQQDDIQGRGGDRS